MVPFVVRHSEQTALSVLRQPVHRNAPIQRALWTNRGGVCHRLKLTHKGAHPSASNLSGMPGPLSASGTLCQKANDLRTLGFRYFPTRIQQQRANQATLQFTSPVLPARTVTGMKEMRPSVLNEARFPRAVATEPDVRYRVAEAVLSWLFYKAYVRKRTG